MNICPLFQTAGQPQQADIPTTIQKIVNLYFTHIDTIPFFHTILRVAASLCSRTRRQQNAGTRADARMPAFDPQRRNGYRCASTRILRPAGTSIVTDVTVLPRGSLHVVIFISIAAPDLHTAASAHERRAPYDSAARAVLQLGGQAAVMTHAHISVAERHIVDARRHIFSHARGGIQHASVARGSIPIARSQRPRQRRTTPRDIHTRSTSGRRVRERGLRSPYPER